MRKLQEIHHARLEGDYICTVCVYVAGYEKILHMGFFCENLVCKMCYHRTNLAPHPNLARNTRHNNIEKGAWLKHDYRSTRGLQLRNEELFCI